MYGLRTMNNDIAIV